jgi:hypothetical protein
MFILWFGKTFGGYQFQIKGAPSAVKPVHLATEHLANRQNLYSPDKAARYSRAGIVTTIV